MTVAQGSQGTSTSSADEVEPAQDVVVNDYGQFAQIPLDVLLDESLSNNAKLLYAHLWAFTSGSRDAFPSRRTLAGRMQVSLNTIDRYLAELVAGGFIDRWERRRADGSQTSNVYRIIARRAAPVGTPLPTHGEPPLPTHGEPMIKNQIVQESVKRERASALSNFDEFYAVWPRKVGKPEAKTAYFQALKRADPRLILAAAVAYRDNPNLPPKGFIPHPSTWLRRDGWHDELPGPRTEVVKHAGQPAPKPGPNERVAAVLGLQDPRVTR